MCALRLSCQEKSKQKNLRKAGHVCYTYTLFLAPQNYFVFRFFCCGAFGAPFGFDKPMSFGFCLLSVDDNRVNLQLKGVNLQLKGVNKELVLENKIYLVKIPHPIVYTEYIYICIYKCHPFVRRCTLLLENLKSFICMKRSTVTMRHHTFLPYF